MSGARIELERAGHGARRGEPVEGHAFAPADGLRCEGRRVSREGALLAALFVSTVTAGCHAPAPPVAPVAECPGGEREEWAHLPMRIGGHDAEPEDDVLGELVRTLAARDDVLLLRVESYDCAQPGGDPLRFANARAADVARMLRERGVRLPIRESSYSPERRVVGCSLCPCLLPRSKRSTRSKCSITCPADEAEVLRLERRVEFSIYVRVCEGDAGASRSGT